MTRPHTMTGAVLIVAALLVLASPGVAIAAPGEVVQDEVLVSGRTDSPDDPQSAASASAPGEISGVSGRLAVNLASGDGNQQINSAVIAIGDVAVGTSSVTQSIARADARDRTTHVALTGNAFADSSGLISVNIVAGVQNQTANLAVLSLGNHGAISDQLLEQSRAPIEPSGSSGGAGLRNDVVDISDDAFRDSSGLIQVNLIGGEGNSSANTFALTVLGEVNP